MAKRLTDSEKWKIPFFKALPSAYKLLWLYIKDDCDFCGFWIPDFEVAQLRIGEKLSEKKAVELFGPQVNVLEDGRWFIPSFVYEQYNELQPTNAFHRKVIAAIEKSDAFVNHDVNRMTTSTTVKTESKHTVDSEQCKDIDKDKDINNNKKEPEIFELSVWPTFDDFWNVYDKKNDRNKCEKAWAKIPQADREKIMEHVPRYKVSQPDRKFRKDPYTYLYNKSWTNEIYESGTTKTGGEQTLTPESANEIRTKFSEAANRRGNNPRVQPNAGSGENK